MSNPTRVTGLAERLVPTPLEACCEALAETVDAWDAEYDSRSGTLTLPVSAGLSRGTLKASLTLAEAPGGTVVRIEPQEQRWQLRRKAVAFLGLAGVGTVISLLWPLFPALLPLAPFGVATVLAAWFLVLSRLTNSGPEEFLLQIEQAAAGGADGSPVSQEPSSERISPRRE